MTPVDMKGGFKSFLVSSFMENRGCVHLEFIAVTMDYKNNQCMWQQTTKF